MFSLHSFHTNLNQIRKEVKGHSEVPMYHSKGRKIFLSSKGGDLPIITIGVAEWT